jgi:hypothetical protein
MSIPTKVLLATRLMGVLWSLGSLYLCFAWMTAWRSGNPGTTVLAASYLVIIVLLGLLIRAVAKGRNWARITYAAIAVLGVVSIALTWLRAEALTFPGTLLLLAVPVAYIVIVGLLFHPTARPWFKRTPSDAT